VGLRFVNDSQAQDRSIDRHRRQRIEQVRYYGGWTRRVQEGRMTPALRDALLQVREILLRTLGRIDAGDMRESRFGVTSAMDLLREIVEITSDECTGDRK
jgi:hypothetical protein